MKRWTFLRWAGAALLAGFIGVRGPELELEEEAELEFETTDMPGWREVVGDGRADAFYAYGTSYMNLVVKNPGGVVSSLPL